MGIPSQGRPRLKAGSYFAAGRTEVNIFQLDAVACAAACAVACAAACAAACAVACATAYAAACAVAYAVVCAARPVQRPVCAARPMLRPVMRPAAKYAAARKLQGACRILV